MQRYFTNQVLDTGTTYEVAENDIHHMKNVMRFQPDDVFEMVDAHKKLYICTVTDVTDTISYEVTSEQRANTELPVSIKIICPLLKGEKFDWMLQKATELGATAFIIYEADRSIVKLDEKKKRKRLERYQKIVKEASEQSKRLNIPDIYFAGKLDDVNVQNDSAVFFAFEGLAGHASKSLKYHTGFKDLSQVSFIFGPEGGFSEREIKISENFTSVSLGTRILRAETAPLYFLSAVSLMVD